MPTGQDTQTGLGVSPLQLPHPQLWVSPRRGQAQSCDCWNTEMGSFQKVPWPTGFILAMCFCLLPWHLPCLLTLGPLAPEQQVLALWLLLLMLTHGVCCLPVLHSLTLLPPPICFFFFFLLQKERCSCWLHCSYCSA